MIKHQNIDKRYLASLILTLVLSACGGGSGSSDPNSEQTSVPTSNPSVTLEKSTNGSDSDTAPGAELIIGNTVEWNFLVTNSGDVPLSNLTVTDEQIEPASTPPVPICEIASLPAGESRTCTATGTVIEGQYQNLGKVTANTDSGVTLNSDDRSHYIGTDASLIAIIMALPISGDAPLTTRFTPSAETENAVVLYEWDFDGDGEYDTSETVGRNQSYTFNSPGVYTVGLRVTDSLGETATETLQITVNNGAPSATVALAPSNGEVPLTIRFTASANDPEGIAQYEWDFDGDGTFDETTTGSRVTHIYDTAGRFQARLRVSDNLGASTTLTVPTLEVNALPEGSPTVTLSASPDDGNAPLDVSFRASARDPDRGSITSYEWDFDGDGTYDQTTTDGRITHEYTAIGTYYPRVRVTDSGGQQSEDVVRVYVEPLISLTLAADTVAPRSGEAATINTTLVGDTTVSIVIENSAGQLVRTLVPLTARVSGDYIDSWDGLNNLGQLVAEGQYRAIVLYQLDGAIERFDLALTTGGQQSNPPRSAIPASFAPIDGDPLEVTFTLEQASEVTAFMGLFNVNTRLVTFFQRQVLGRGEHTVVWNGEDSDGRSIPQPVNDSFLFGVFAYELPDNGIYMRSAVHVDSVLVTPAILQPTSANGESGQSQILVNLDRAGSVRLTVNDADSGVAVASFNYPGLTGGENTITWDGKDNQGAFVAPGNYRLGVTGIDENGFATMTMYALQRVFY